jgi:hypothetical protein
MRAAAELGREFQNGTALAMKAKFAKVIAGVQRRKVSSAFVLVIY